MKKLIFLLMFAMGPFAGAGIIQSYMLDTSGSSLGTTFTTNPQIGATDRVRQVDISNGTTSVLELNCVATSVPASNDPGGWYIDAGLSFHHLSLSLGKKCWIRALTTASSGVVVLAVEGP